MSDKNFLGKTFDKESSFAGVNFVRSVLCGCKLDNVDFSNADFRGADLSNATVEGCNFYGANFTGANLQGVDFSGANLHDVVGDRKYIKSIYINDVVSIVYTFNTIFFGCTSMPLGFIIPYPSTKDPKYPGTESILRFVKKYGQDPSWDASHPLFIDNLTRKIEPALRPSIPNLEFMSVYSILETN